MGKCYNNLCAGAALCYCASEAVMWWWNETRNKLNCRLRLWVWCDCETPRITFLAFFLVECKTIIHLSIIDTVRIYTWYINCVSCKYLKAPPALYHVIAADAKGRPSTTSAPSWTQTSTTSLLGKNTLKCHFYHINSCIFVYLHIFSIHFCAFFLGVVPGISGIIVLSVVVVLLLFAIVLYLFIKWKQNKQGNSDFCRSRISQNIYYFIVYCEQSVIFSLLLPTAQSSSSNMDQLNNSQVSDHHNSWSFTVLQSHWAGNLSLFFIFIFT